MKRITRDREIVEIKRSFQTRKLPGRAESSGELQNCKAKGNVDSLIRNSLNFRSFYD